MPETCKFDVSFKGSIQDVLARAAKAAKKDKAEFKGDETSGTFAVPDYKIKGTYQVKGQKISFELSHPGGWIEEEVIESRVRSFIE